MAVQLFQGLKVPRAFEMMKVWPQRVLYVLLELVAGVGYTLETLLGIAANSSKAPDYKGIEIKSGRQKSSEWTFNCFFTGAKLEDKQAQKLKRYFVC